MELSKTNINKNGELVYISGGLETNIKGVQKYSLDDEFIWLFYVKI